MFANWFNTTAKVATSNPQEPPSTVQKRDAKFRSAHFAFPLHRNSWNFQAQTRWARTFTTPTSTTMSSSSTGECRPCRPRPVGCREATVKYPYPTDMWFCQRSWLKWCPRPIWWRRPSGDQLAYSSRADGSTTWSISRSPTSSCFGDPKRIR